MSQPLPLIPLFNRLNPWLLQPILNNRYNGDHLNLPLTIKQPTMSKPCIHCGSNNTLHLYDNHDYISGEIFPIAYCQDCHTTYTPGNLDPDSLINYYGTDIYYGNAGRRFIGLIETMIGWFRHHRTQLIRHYHPQPGAVLDIGCGRGLMLAELKAAGWDSTGVEFSRELAQAGSAKHQLPIIHSYYLTDCQLPSQHFDVVTLWHVLEHLIQPLQTIEEIQRILKPGGHLIIEVPNIYSWQAKLSQGDWFHLDAPRHLYHFSPEGLQKMLRAKGFEVVKVSTWSLEYGPYGLLQGLLNRLTVAPNVLYCLLKRQCAYRPNYKPGQKLWDYAISIGLLPPLLVASILLEGIAALNGHGGVIKVIARKPLPATAQ